MDITLDVKEDPVCPNGTLTLVKSEFGQFETVFVPSHGIQECANNSKIDSSEMCNKIKIKEEPCWPESTSNEIKQELELPSTAHIDLKNEIKETTSHTEVITGGAAAEASRFYAESTCRNINSASCFHTSTNSGESSWENNAADITEESQLFNYCQPQLFEEPDSNYTLVSNMKSSRLVHNGKIPHTCETCSKSFKFLYELKHHNNVIHEGIRPYKCEICSKTFTKLSHLKRHKLTHGERLHLCEVCNKSFIRASDMKMHKLAHEGVRPYKCLICNKSFTWASNLKEHKKIHEGKKPYTCEICNKTFTQITNLKQHKITHEGKRPHICEVCNKSFTLVSLLKQHKLIHGEKQHTCEICKKSFTRAGHLKVHMSTHEKRVQTAKS